ncbi:TPA: hypothetical protein QCU33_005317 [Bacillus cereus]|nr:hypothetical protein [Bacillus cereus]
MQRKMKFAVLVFSLLAVLGIGKIAFAAESPEGQQMIKSCNKFMESYQDK